MSVRVEELARQIASLKEADFQELLERVEELNFRSALKALSDRHVKRLKDQGDLNEEADEILLKLKQLRQEIASREYPG